MKQIKKINLLSVVTLLGGLLFFASCGDDDDDPNPTPTPQDAGFLASNVDALGEIDLGDFDIPSEYVESGATSGTFAPAKYSGQLTRRAQLGQIVDVLRDEPIAFDIKTALADGTLFTGNANNDDTKIFNKIDENTVGSTVGDDFASLADSIVNSSNDNYTVSAQNGVAGMITTGDKKRHVSANGLEYAQIIEKGLFGPLLYDQIVDDYLRPSQAGSESTNNETAAGADYAEEGTARQHAFDEAYGYFGVNDLAYPNSTLVESEGNGGGEFIANYTFDFSDETEAAYGINLADKIMNAFIVGRSALKAGEGFGPTQETTNEAVYEAARADIKLYTEAGLAAAANHYLNDALADVTDADKLHHLSEALGFIYALSFNSEGRLTSTEAAAVLQELGWGSDTSLNGIYEINLWNVTDSELQAAKDKLNESFPGYGSIAF